MKEIRSIETSEFRVIPESRRIEGYALLFNKESNDLGGFKEVISRNALDGVLEQSDILALYNHEENKVLARNTGGKGSLSLTIDERGLKYSFIAPLTPTGEEVYSAIQRGDLRNSSFAFTTTEEGQKWEKRDGAYLRTITKFERLYDVSPVYRPAYQDTTVAVRSLDLIKNENIDNRDEKNQYIIKGSDLISVLEKNKINDVMDERQEITVEVKVEVCEDMGGMPTDPAELTDTPDIMDPTDPNMEPVEPEMEPEMEPVDPEMDPNSPDAELIDVVIDGENYSIPKNILEPYLRSRKLEKYFENLEKSIEELKK